MDPEAPASLPSEMIEACTTGDLQRLDASMPLYTSGALRNAKIIEPLLVAAVQSKQAEVVRYLLEFDPDFKIPRETANAAASSDFMEVYGVMLQRQPEIANFDHDRIGDTVIFSIINDDTVFLNFLLEHGVDPGRDPAQYFGRHWSGNAPLELAVCRSRTDIVELLLHYGARIHQTEAIQLAAWSGRLDLLEFLLDKGADVNAVLDEEVRDFYRGPTFGTALHNAIQKDQIDAVRLLLDRGADSAVLDTDGKSSVARAQERGNARILALMCSDSR
ncbi:MAG: hypothetical protein M1821_007580 [Bathelium mastoideum]|nr:MAG: hypothetical protein M1821_007580 [Bathelium mastoideum]KAI9675477.1 MAG: hypothetical protein M1822_008955 [Bathelium mastoideum]